MDGLEYFKPEFRLYTPSFFSVFYFSTSVLFWVSPNVCQPLGLLQFLVILFMVVYSFSFSVMCFLFPDFASELICFLCIWLFISLYVFSADLSIEFSVVILESPVLFILLVLLSFVPISFESPFFFNIFQLFSSSFIASLANNCFSAFSFYCTRIIK